MAERKNKRKRRVTDDKHIEGVDPLDAPPEDIAPALFAGDRVANSSANTGPGHKQR